MVKFVQWTKSSAKDNSRLHSQWCDVNDGTFHVSAPIVANISKVPFLFYQDFFKALLVLNISRTIISLFRLFFQNLAI